jgi:uncharacterized membrane protein
MDITVARIVHVLSIVLWIGGVAFVTTVLIPAIRRTSEPRERLAAFVRFESAFSWQAKISVALAGASGLYMTWRLNAWARFADPHLWWMDAMVLLWAVFAAILFVAEPLVLHRRLNQAIASGDSAPLFDRMERFHRWMLLASLITVIGAVGGSHGLWG